MDGTAANKLQLPGGNKLQVPGADELQGFMLTAAVKVAPTAGVPVELGGVRWSQYLAPAEVAPGAVSMFDLDDEGEFQTW